MTTLRDALITDDSKRRVLIDDCVRLIDSEVSRKRGFSGIAVKAGFKVVKSVKPGFVRTVIDMLFDEFIAEVEPFYTSWKDGGSGAFGDHLKGQRREVASALLNVTDRRAARAQTRSVRKAYDKLRPSAAGHVEDAIDGMGAILQRHLNA